MFFEYLLILSIKYSLIKIFFNLLLYILLFKLFLILVNTPLINSSFSNIFFNINLNINYYKINNIHDLDLIKMIEDEIIKINLFPDFIKFKLPNIFEIKTSELLNNELVNNLAKSIVDNDSFFEKCKKSLNNILKDNIIDSKDIPHILNLLVITFNSDININIDKNKIKDVFILVFVHLIDKLELNKNIDLDNIILLLEPQIDLLLIKINNNKNFKFNCCSSKKIDI